MQAYVKDAVTSVTWAERELKAFVQVEIAAGESVVVEVAVPAAAWQSGDR